MTLLKLLVYVLKFVLLATTIFTFLIVTEEVLV